MLTIIPVTTEIILAGRADAVAAPVAITQQQPVQQRIIGIDSTALAHSHMMRRVKTARTNISPRSSHPRFPVYGVQGTQRITVVFNQPEVMF